MAIDWDEVRKKAQARGAANEAQVAEIQARTLPKATPSLPTAPLPTTHKPLYSPSVRRVGQPIAQAQREKIAAKTYEDFDNTPTRAIAGFVQGLSPADTKKDFHPAIQTNREDFTGGTAYKAGEIGGIMAQFAIPYAGAAKGITALPKVAGVGNVLGQGIGRMLPRASQQTMQRIGQGIAGSVATDLAVGLPLNANIALNKEGLRGVDAAKSIAINTGIDLITGGILEAVPMFLKSGKKVASKADFEKLTPIEKEEVLLMLPAPKPNMNESKLIPDNKIIAGGQILDKKFSPKSKDDYVGELAEKVGKLDTPMWGNYNSLYGQTIKRQADELIQEMDNVSKMSDAEWEVYASQKGIGQNSVNFNVKQEPQLPPLEFKRTITPNELPRATKPIPQAPTKTVQPILPQKGTEIPKEQPFAQSGLKSVGADTFKGGKTIDQLNKEYGALPKGEVPRAREVDIPKKTDYGEVQQYARTLQESAIVDDTLFKDINEAITQGSFTKPTKSNKTAVENANFTLEQAGLDGAMNKFRSVLAADKTPTSEDIALGNRVLQELQKEGRYGDALDVAIDLSQMLSETGRTLQAARIAKRLSPEGRLMTATRIADKVAKKTGKKVKLSDETTEAISKAKTEDDIVKANQKAATEIWNQVPANWIDKVNAWRYMSMLTNPKTHIRNIVGNALFVPAREFKNLIGAGLERSFLPKAGEKTKAVLNPIKDKAIMDFASKDFQNVKSILKNEGKLDDNVRNLDAKVFDNKILEGMRKLNMNALDAEDTWFMKFAYDSSLAQYMKANKIPVEKMAGETLEKGRKYAMNEALKATYRDYNALSRLISRGKTKGASGEWGPAGKAFSIALEGMVPFSKTPLNIVKRGVGYSPANIVRGIVNLGRVKTGKVTATEAIDQLASGLSGTAIMGIGILLGYNQLVTGKEGEYKDKLYNYNQMLGSQNYSLNIDGKSYTLDWAAPLSMPFFVGVELSKAIKDNNADPGAVIDAMTQISDPMVNLSMLKGINDIVTNNFEGIGQTVRDIGLGYAGQFVPTVGGQIARTADQTRRSTIATNENKTGRALEKFGRKQLAKLPKASEQLQPYVDLWGREQKNGNFAENFLSPGYFKQENITPVDRELQSLMKKMDEETAKKILPSSTAYKYTVESAGTAYRMTEKESTAYQKTRGQESYKGLEKLFKSVEYRSMTQEEKVKAVGDVYSEADQKAKYQYFDSKGLPVTLALDKSYQEKYQGIKAYMTDKRFYAAVTDMKGKPRDIEKVYAIDRRGPVSNKFYEAFDISQETVSKARALKQTGITVEQYTKSADATTDIKSDPYINSKGNEDSIGAGSTAEKRGLGKSASLKKKEKIDELYPGLSWQKRQALYEAFGVSEKVW